MRSIARSGRSLVTGGVVLCAAAVAGVAAAGSSVWTAKDIGHPGSFADVYPVALNDHGVAAANNLDDNASAVKLAFLSDHGKIRQLSVPGTRYVQVSAVNDAGVAAGIARIGKSGNEEAVMWFPGRSVPVRLSDPAEQSASDLFLNDQNEAVFDEQASSTDTQHVVFSKPLAGRATSATTLPTLGGTIASATGLNDQGIVTGISATSDGGYHAFSWQDGTLTDLGSIGTHNSRSAAINDAGLIVGGVETRKGLHISAVEWKNGRLIDLGTFGAPRATAVAVNGAGDVLVQTFQKNSQTLGAALFRANGTTSRIATPVGGSPINVVALNDHDQVLGYAANGRSFIWQNGAEMLLPPSRDPAAVGLPIALNNAGQALGTDFVAAADGTASRRGVIWQRR